MKKIPTLFERQYNGKIKVGVLPNVTEGMEWVLQGEGRATVKYDGTACAIINGEFYRRYDAKKGKPVPEGAIKCQENPDEVTGHLPCWVKCSKDNPADKWHIKAFENSGFIENGTYEAVGIHFQNNKYGLSEDTLYRHGDCEVEVERTFEGIKTYLTENKIEGLVFWKDNEPKCKIKRSDFGLTW